MKPLLFIAAACVVLASTILASASSETGTDAGVTFVNVSYWSGPAYVVSRVHAAGYGPADIPLRTAQAERKCFSAWHGCSASCILAVGVNPWRCARRREWPE